MTELITPQSLEDYLLRIQDEMLTTMQREELNNVHDDLLTYPCDRAETIEEVITEIREHFGMKKYPFVYPEEDYSSGDSDEEEPE